MIVFGIIIFTAIIIGLVLILMLAESKLVAQGSVNMLINGDDALTKKVAPGTNLLNALSDNKIFIPSACGGGGSCAMCKCQVIEGGGDLLPTEAGHVSRKEAADNWRLACQVKIKDNIKIQVPDEIFNIKKFRCKVKSNLNQATFIKELILEIQDGDILDFEAGGYIQIDVPKYENIKFSDFDIQQEYREDWDKMGLWDLVANNPEPCFRAYSMGNHPAEGNIVLLNIRIAHQPWDRAANKWMDVPPGLCSSFVFNLKEGDEVFVSGPYGEFFINESDSEMVYIGGGAGMAPLRSHLFHLFHTLKTGRKVSYWYGARSRREIFYEDHFRKIEEEFPNFKFHLALSDPLPEDNWDGYTGFIHNVVYENHLKNHEAPEDIEYYMCGPPIMIKCVKDLLYDMGVEEEMVRCDDFGI